MNSELYIKKANLLKALGHPLRLKIIDILHNEDITVTELCKRLDEEQANVSRQLSILRKEEVIDYHKKGVSTYYYVKYECLMNLNLCLNEVMKRRLQGDASILKTL